MALTSGAVKILVDSPRQTAQWTLAVAVPIGNRTSNSPSRGQRYPYVAKRVSSPGAGVRPALSIGRPRVGAQDNGASREP